MTRSRVAATAALIFLLGACGGGDGGEVAGPTGGTSAPSSAAAETECTAEATAHSLVAENLDFDVDCLAVPADIPFTIELTNLDPDLSHDVAISDNPHPDFDDWLFDGEVIGGSETMTYEIDGLPEGEYFFFCSVHPLRMSGDLLVGQAA
jgi:plastocyanin